MPWHPWHPQGQQGWIKEIQTAGYFGASALYAYQCVKTLKNRSLLILEIQIRIHKRFGSIL